MITKTSLMNAAIALSATAASTNAILHLLAIATEAGVSDFDIDAFDTISRTTPVIGDLKPGGKYMAFDLYAAGGSALIGKRLVEDGRIEDQATVTGRSLFEACFEVVQNNGIKKGDVVIIRNEGPCGGPGMREMLGVTAALVGQDLADHVALITDGRFSGASYSHLIIN